MANPLGTDSSLARYAGSEAELLPVSLSANCIFGLTGYLKTHDLQQPRNRTD